MSARGYRSQETRAEPDGVRPAWCQDERNVCAMRKLPNPIHSYRVYIYLLPILCLIASNKLPAMKEKCSCCEHDEKMVVRNLMIHPLSILVSPKKLKSLGFLKYFPSFWFPYKTIYSNKKYTYCFKVFGISASTRNVSSFRVQIPLTASLDISFSDLVFPFCCCNHRFDSSLSDSLDKMFYLCNICRHLLIVQFRRIRRRVNLTLTQN